MANITGKTFGRYQAIETLGEGGMAAVYKGYDPRLSRDVAIKVILRGYENQAIFLKRFEREAKAVAQLTHPNIVKVFDFGTEEGMPYLVMEYITGGALSSRLGKPIPWDQSTQMLLPIARTLDYAHSNHLIHRDIKPANLLVTTTGDLMLSDFGIAKTLDAEDLTKLTGTGMGIGTPAYMAPEQGMGQAIDLRVDVYSLGVVLYEMVTGRQPYQGPTPMAIMLKHLNEPLPHPRQFVPDLPEAVVQILYRALAKEPAQRYQGMSDFARPLEDLTRITIPQPVTLLTSSQEETQATPPRLDPLTQTRNSRGQAEADLPEKVQPWYPDRAEPPAAGTKRISQPVGVRMAAMGQKLPRRAWIAGGAVVLVLLLAFVIWGGDWPAGFLRRIETPNSATQAVQVAVETELLAVNPTSTLPPMDTPTITPSPTGTPIPSPTPVYALVAAPRDIGGAYLRAAPGYDQEVITAASNGTLIQLLSEVPSEANGVPWLHIRLSDGRDGWMVQSVLLAATPAPTSFFTNTPRPKLSPTPTGFPPLITDEYGVPMAWVPAGPFEMGSEDGDEDEKPVHTVELDDFYIDIYEVTNSRYAACVDAGACDPPENYNITKRDSYYGDPTYANYPVINVNWYDAQTYCEWREAHLPTEAEWEKAARGGLAGKAFPWGDEAPVCEPGAINGAKFDDNSNCDDTDAEPIGSYSPNGYGLYDMAGNVWEWVADWYDVYPGGDSGASENFGEKYRVLRGGSWLSKYSALRVANRTGYGPDSTWFDHVFRCARSP